MVKRARCLASLPLEHERVLDGELRELVAVRLAPLLQRQLAQVRLTDTHHHHHGEGGASQPQKNTLETPRLSSTDWLAGLWAGWQSEWLAN